MLRAMLLCSALVFSIAARAGEPLAPSTSSIGQGRALYARHCSHCHGFNMVNPGTISYDLRKFPKDDEARFFNSVTNGKNGRMPPWAGVLSRAEMEQIWAYVVSGGKQ
jgi:mono/diheme cytochrome c family protein